MVAVALQLTRLGVLMGCVRKAVDAVRREHQAGELEFMAFQFNNAGRVLDAARMSRVAPFLDEPAEPSAGSAGPRLLIDLGAEASNIDTKLRQRPDHEVVRRGP